MTKTTRATVDNELLHRFVSDDTGQDLIEYALLAALVGVASFFTWQLIVGSVGDAYTSAETAAQDLSACTPDPGGGGC